MSKSKGAKNKNSKQSISDSDSSGNNEEKYEGQKGKKNEVLFPKRKDLHLKSILQYSTISFLFICLIASSLLLYKPFRMYVRETLLIMIPGIRFRLMNHPLPTQSVIWGHRIMNEKNKFRRLSSNLDQPNIVLIVADDLGINDLSGGVGVQTPNIDSIKFEGMNFINAYSAQATCAPARASIFTGRSPTKIGYEFTPIPVALAKLISFFSGDDEHPPIWNKEYEKGYPKAEELVIPKNITTIAEYLKRRGYFSYLIGKWHLGHSTGHTPLNRGFDETITFPSLFSNYLPKNDPRGVEVELPGSFHSFDKFLRYNLPFTVSFNDGKPFEPDEYLTDYLTHRAVDLINSKKNSQNPFFLALTYTAPHNPLVAKKEDYDSLPHISDHTQRVYASMIKALDRGVGEILDAINSSGSSENTLIIFTSDNGAAHYTGIKQSNFPYRGWKATFFEGGIRVPMFMKWPLVIPSFSTFDSIVGLIDIFATIRGASTGKYSLLNKLNDSVKKIEIMDDKDKEIEEYESELSSKLDGIDLIHHLVCHGKKIDKVVCQKNKNFYTGDILTQNEQKLLNKHEEIPHKNLFWRSGHYKVIRYFHWKLQISERPDKIWLFYLRRDPLEKVNLASKILDIKSLSELDNLYRRNFNFNSTKLVENTIDLNLSDLIFDDSKHYSEASFGSIEYAKFHKLEEILLNLYNLLLIENGKQVDPLWPPLFEGLVPIDKTGFEKLNEKDEFVYFAN